jgi:hypothetical protein
MAAIRIQLLGEIDRFQPVINGILKGRYDRDATFNILPNLKDAVIQPNASLIEIMYKCQFNFKEQSASYVKLSRHGSFEIHHSMNQIVDNGDVLRCLLLLTENLKYVVPETGIVLDGSVNIGEPLPLQIP